jgi:hypothetical protein
MGPVSCNIADITANTIDHTSDDDPELQHNAYARTMPICAVHTTSRSHSNKLQNKLSQTFSIGLKTAQSKNFVSTQLALRRALHPIYQCFRTEVAQLRFPHLGGHHGKFHRYFLC